jgi:hypothetical protein
VTPGSGIQLPPVSVSIGMWAPTITFLKVRPLKVRSSSIKIGSCYVLSSIRENASVDEDKLFFNDLVELSPPPWLTSLYKNKIKSNSQ